MVGVSCSTAQTSLCPEAWHVCHLGTCGCRARSHPDSACLLTPLLAECPANAQEATGQKPTRSSITACPCPPQNAQRAPCRSATGGRVSPPHQQGGRVRRGQPRTAAAHLAPAGGTEEQRASPTSCRGHEPQPGSKPGSASPGGASGGLLASPRLGFILQGGK